MALVARPPTSLRRSHEAGHREQRHRGRSQQGRQQTELAAWMIQRGKVRSSHGTYTLPETNIFAPLQVIPKGHLLRLGVMTWEGQF